MPHARASHRKTVIEPVPLGHGPIDSDHRELASFWWRVVSSTPLQFPFFLARFKKLMSEHFDREAAIMAQHNTRLCECHVREHRELLRLCDCANQLNGHNYRQAQDFLRREFPPRIREHIICMDQLLVLFINTNGSIGSLNHDCPVG